MGVEYRHFMVVDDALWRPQGDTATRVEAVLRDWSIIGEVEQIIDLPVSGQMPDETVNSAAAPGPGVAVVFAGATGPAVAAIAGPSLYADIEPNDRYLKRTTLVIGDDYRLQWSPYTVYFELVCPPMADGMPIAGSDVDAHDCLFAASYPSAGATTPPVVIARLQGNAKESLAWDACLGFWRGGLVLDFGKDLPAFCEQVQALPARAFVAALSDAFRGRLVDIGDFY